MRILIIGAGGVGGYFGARLALAGQDVTFVARGPHGAAIADHGLHVETPDGVLEARLPVVSDVDGAQGFGADLVIVAVKARDLDEVAKTVGGCLAEGGLVLPLLNGVDSEAVLSAALGPGRVVGGVANIASEVSAPGVLRVRQHGSLVLAPTEDGQLEAVEELARVLGSAGFSCRASRDLGRVLWRKLLWNAPFNGICALTRRSAGEAVAVPELRELVASAMQEVVAVAAALGVTMPDDVVEATLASTETHFAETVPSMLQDVLAGRPTETDALQGAVVRHGRRLGVPVPLHETLWALLRGLETSTRRNAT